MKGSNFSVPSSDTTLRVSKKVRDAINSFKKGEETVDQYLRSVLSIPQKKDTPKVIERKKKPMKGVYVQNNGEDAV